MNTAATQSIHLEKVLFIALVCACLSLFALYIYFLSASIVHVVMRTEIHQESTRIASEISELESKYIEAQHRVSSDIASLQGYSPVISKVFIDSTPTSLVLSTVTQ